MPPLFIRSGGSLRRTLLVVTLAAVVAPGAYAFSRVGFYLVDEDPLVKADAVFVLAGTRMLRPLEGANLVLAGYAPRLVLTRDPQDPAEPLVAGRGPAVLADADRAREVFVAMGVPRDTILVTNRIHDSTAEEAVTLRELAQQHGWRRVIVVTSRFHLRRAGFAMRREVDGIGLDVVMRASRYDPLRPERWWTRRAESRWVASELPKLIAYMLGLGA